MSGKWLLPFLIIAAIAPFVVYFYDGGKLNSIKKQQHFHQPVATIQFEQPNLQRIMEPGAQFGIVTMSVLDGYKFKLQLDNGQWIEAHLAYATKPEATPLVVDMFQQPDGQPSVILYRKIENYWIVDLQIGFESLKFLLQQEGLVY